MPAKSPYFFVSYSRKDRDIVEKIVERINQAGISTWTDVGNLQAGDSWRYTIEDSLRNAIGIIVFISAASMESDWVMHELSYALGRKAPVIPVLLERVRNLPLQLQTIQYLDLSKDGNFDVGIVRLIQTLTDFLKANRVGIGLNEAEIREVVAETTEQARSRKTKHPTSQKPPDSVFIVHGHDTHFLSEVESFLNYSGIKTIVLSKMPNTQQSLLSKFFAFSEDVYFAVVLISADDRGASRKQYDSPEGVGEHSLQFRARQNVILELGFFYGYLGWDYVFVLFKSPDKSFPNFEFPSDLSGVPYDEVDQAGNWKDTLTGRLRKAGFIIA